MLYDPKWQVEVKTDPFTLESLIAWLEKMPADGVYCYTDGGACLLHQYYTSCGFKDVQVHGWGRWSHSGAKRIESPDGFWPVSADPSLSRDWTFGAALSRARALLPRDA